MIGTWDEGRPTEGAYSAFLTFENGMVATAIYSGYAHFDSDELLNWQSELGTKKHPEAYWTSRENLRLVTQDKTERAAKVAQNYGGSLYQPVNLKEATTRSHQHFGNIVVSCKHADIRPLPSEIIIYGDNKRSKIELPKPTVPRAEVIDELVSVVVDGHEPLHSGTWATATLEVCLGILASATSGDEINMSHQCGLAP